MDDPLFRLDLGRDVFVDRHEVARATPFVGDRRHRLGHGEQLPVLAAVDHPPAPRLAAEDRPPKLPVEGLLLPARLEDPWRLADRLFLRVAAQPLEGRVDELDAALGVRHEDGVGRRLHGHAEQTLVVELAACRGPAAGPAGRALRPLHAGSRNTVRSRPVSLILWLSEARRRGPAARSRKLARNTSARAAPRAEQDPGASSGRLRRGGERGVLPLVAQPSRLLPRAARLPTFPSSFLESPPCRSSSACPTSARAGTARSSTGSPPPSPASTASACWTSIPAPPPTARSSPSSVSPRRSSRAPSRASAKPPR